MAARRGRGDGEGVGLERGGEATGEGGDGEEDVVGWVPAVEDGLVAGLPPAGLLIWRRGGDVPVCGEEEGVFVENEQVHRDVGAFEGESPDEAVGEEDCEGNGHVGAAGVEVKEEKDKGGGL